jgi:hypothetical protein
MMLKTFQKKTLIKGQPAEITCVEIDGQIYTLSRGPLKILALEEEWYEDVQDPPKIVSLLGNSSLGVDLFTFWQRIPRVEPRYDFYREWESLAVLPVSSYDHWLNNQIKPRTRNLIKKAAKQGLTVREAVFDDDFVRGMTEIFNETPIRQGRKFWHYGKELETVRKQFSRFLFREDLIGAYYENRLIGFMMLADAGPFVLTGQILSTIEHRDKATNNALIAKAVELCAQKGHPYLVYLFWGEGSFSEFKRRCGFQKIEVPRYYVPLSLKGRMAMATGLHHGWKEAIPDRLKKNMKTLRTRWLTFTQRSQAGSCPD